MPTVKVGDVEVGEVFSRTVEYRYIRPTILGHGLQTSSFGWIFTGESPDASAKRMFAVIGVPRGTKEITAKFQLVLCEGGEVYAAGIPIGPRLARPNIK